MLLREEVPVLGVMAVVLLKLRAPPDMERREVGLQPGVLVRGDEPAVAAKPRIAVEAHDVVVARLQVYHAGLQAVVASTEYGGGVFPLVRVGPETRNAPYRHVSGHLLGVELLAEGAPLLHHELQRVPVDHELVCEGVLHIQHPRACLHREAHLFLASVDLQGDCPEVGAIDLAPHLGLPLGVEHVQAQVYHRSLVLPCLLAPCPQGCGRRRLPLDAAHVENYAAIILKCREYGGGKRPELPLC
mmetsp:Transcript_62409/g.176010  ORF Transcript_62409/g.176010 Transcript_62409/m.176010 type:complete len:244 (-) Transcript_62409:21-752(-)